MISNNHGSLEEAAERGQLYLCRLSYDDAEVSFRRVLEGLTSSHPHGDRLRMTSLVGLAEINVRRSRSVIGNVEEWLHGMLCALALHKEAMEIADAAIDRKWKCAAGLPVDNDNFRCFEEVLQKSAAHAKLIEGELVDVIRHEIVANCAKSKPGMYLKSKPVFDIEWLHRLTDYCVTGKRRAIPNQGHDNNNQNPTRVEEPSTAREDKWIGSSANSQVPSTTLKRKIDYERLQEGIRKIVSEVSQDVRSQYLQYRRLVPGQVMQKRHLHELMARLSPGNRDNDDLLNVLDDAVQYEDYPDAIGGGQDAAEVESRKSLGVGEEETQRTGSRRSFRREDRSEIDSVEWEEILKKEERMHRDNKDKETDNKEDNEDDEDEDTDCVNGRRLVSSGPHSVGLYKRNTESAKYDRSSCVKRGVRGAISSCARDREVLRRPSDFFVQSDVRSRKQNSDFRNGTSGVSESGQSVGGLSGAFCTSGILTLWRSTRPPRKANRPEPTEKKLHNFEEVSPLTERDKVLRWLQSVEPEPRPKSLDRGGRVAAPTTHPSGDRVGQTIGHLVLRVADSFREDSKSPEAYEMYKFAMGLFQKYPLVTGQTQMVADLLLRVGMVKCSMGQLATGSQLMEESIGLLERGTSAAAGTGRGDAFKVAEMWFQVGNVYLADRVRRESLQARIMQLIREDVEDEERREDEENRDRDSAKSDQCDSYCVCLHEALACYKRALAVLDSVDADGDRRVPELAIDVFSNMADCYVMTGNLDLAEVGYEEALRLFPQTQGAPLLTRNAHVLSMLGTVSFLLRNFVRSATMFETSNILLQHLQNSEDPTLEKAWTSTMLGLSYSSLDHYDKAVACCIRAFTLYTRVFRGRILDVDGLSRWFIVQTLYVLGIAYTTMDANDKALYYLNLARNMTANSVGESQDDDVHQYVHVLKAIADAYSALEDPDKALVYYEEALERSKSLGDENTTTALKNQLLNRMAGANVDSQKYTAAGGNLEQALDYQKDIESSIKDDMIALLLKLGVTSILACDIDKAINCYTDCMQAFDDCRRKPPDARDVAGVMASLGTLCHVKGCMLDDDDDVDAFMDKAESYFEEAYQLTGTSSPVCVQYANFLYQQGRYADAVEAMLPYVFCTVPSSDEIRYNGIEQAVLPDHLQYDADDEDTLVLETRVFAKFLAVLCYNYLGLSEDADDALVQLYAAAAPSGKSFNLVILGYGLMEMGLFEEAAGSFMVAAWLQPVDCSQAYRNARLCFLVFAYVTVARAMDFLLEYIYDRSVIKDISTPTFDQQRRHHRHVTSSRKTSGCKVVVGSGASQTIGRSPSECFAGPDRGKCTSLESVGPIGGSDLGEDEEEEDSKTTNQERSRGRANTAGGDQSTGGSGDFPVSSGGQVAASEDDAEREEEVWEEWTTEEVIVETPREILELIANQINLQRNLTSSAYNHHHHQRWNKSIDQMPRTPSKPELSRTGTLSRESSFQYGSYDDVPLDNADYNSDPENNRFNPEVDGEPEVNGNKRIDTDSSDEWVVTEEIIETPAEIMALLKRTYSNAY